jgi:hypothetical protein
MIDYNGFIMVDGKRGDEEYDKKCNGNDLG